MLEKGVPKFSLFNTVIKFTCFCMSGYKIKANNYTSFELTISKFVMRYVAK